MDTSMLAGFLLVLILFFVLGSLPGPITRYYGAKRAKGKNDKPAKNRLRRHKIKTKPQPKDQKARVINFNEKMKERKKTP